MPNAPLRAPRPACERRRVSQLNDVRPMTGDEYLESLRDGREIYVYGERVADVTTHPAFRNGARSVAALYDALHAPEAEGVLRVPTDTGNGGWTHPFFKTPKNAAMVALDALDDHHAAAIQRAEHDRLVDGARQLLHGRQRVAAEVEPDAHALAQAQQAPAELVAPARGQRQQADLDHRPQQRMGGRLGHRQRPGDLAHAPLGAIGGEQVEDGPDAPDAGDAAVAHERFGGGDPGQRARRA